MITKEQLKNIADEKIKKYGQKIKVFIYDKAKTFNIPKKESDLGDEDIDIFSGETDPGNIAIEERNEDDNIEYRYKRAREIYALIDIRRESNQTVEGGQDLGDISGDIFTLVSILECAKLPVESSKWTNAYIQYEEHGIIIRKKVNRVELNTRWGNEAIGVDIYFEKDVYNESHD